LILPDWSGPPLRLGKRGEHMANKRPKPEARRDCHEVAAGWRSDGARHAASGCDPANWRSWTDLLPLKEEVRWNGRSPIEGTEAVSKIERATAQSCFWPDAGQVDPGGSCEWKLLSPARRRAWIDRVRMELRVSERLACRVLRQHRSTQRKVPVGGPDEERLVADMIELTRQYGRYGYRRIAALLSDAGWHMNDKRVERLRRREGLKVLLKQPKKGRLWLNDG